MNDQALKENRWQWLRSRWNNLIAGLKSMLGFSKKTVASDQSATSDQGQATSQNDQIEALTKHFEFEPNVFPEMSEDLRMQIRGIMNGSWGLGYADGSIGQRQMTRDFFRAQAEQVRDQYLYFLKGKSIPAQTQAAELKERFEKTCEVLEQAQDYRNDVITRRQLYPRQYSYSLATIYTLFAALLLLADIPLALMVTQLIFDLAPPDKWHDITYLLYQPKNDPCGGLFQHFWKVVTGNWQVTIMTIGVALCAIYFKIFYDDSMGYSVDKSIRQFRMLSMNSRHKNASKEEIKREENHIRNLHHLRIVVKFLILAFTLFTIVHLGYVRAAAEALQEAYKTQITSSDSSNAVGGIENGISKTTSPLIIERTNELHSLKKWMFILLTILLPLIAGICFSLGMGNIHNRKEASYAEKTYWKKVGEHTNVLAAHKEAQMHASTYESFIEKCESDSFVKNYEISFYHCYLHGYQRGVVSPDKDLDLYERAVKFRDRLVATKSNEAIQRANEKIMPVNPITQN